MIKLSKTIPIGFVGYRDYRDRYEWFLAIRTMPTLLRVKVLREDIEGLFTA